MEWHLDSSIPGIAWPSIPAYGQAVTLALVQQLERSQWLSAERLEAEQILQIAPLVRHAWDTVPYYRQLWSDRYDPVVPMTPASFQRLPILPRRALQDNFEQLKSRNVPTQHGPAVEARSSGSTGKPVRVLKTGIGFLFWSALTLRDHLWHQRELHRTLAVIRHGVAPGGAPSWGPATNGLVQTGRSLMLNVTADIEAQWNWLAKQDPTYLLTYPSIVAELAKISLARGLRLPALRQVRTLGEALSADVRKLCREAWDVPLVDLYSAEEVGSIALQCPQHDHYHVQSESLLVEVLDEEGGRCPPGKVGRVVITDLHNFAMPLVRYEIGDYAEVGEPCSCGRGLPVLRSIRGRVRNTLIAPDGRRYWPDFGQHRFLDIAPILQHKVVQRTRDYLEAHLVLREPLTAQQELHLRERILSNLPAGIHINFVRVDRVPRGPGGKFEDFVSEVSED